MVVFEVGKGVRSGIEHDHFEEQQNLHDIGDEGERFLTQI